MAPYDSKILLVEYEFNRSLHRVTLPDEQSLDLPSSGVLAFIQLFFFAPFVFLFIVSRCRRWKIPSVSGVSFFFN